METLPEAKDLSDSSTHFLTITVTSVDFSKKEPTFRFSLETNLNQYPEKSLHDVERTYPEFVRLHQYLVGAHPDLLVPVLPPLAILRTSFSSHDAWDLGSPQDPSRADLQVYLTRLANHSTLRKDLELQAFLQPSFMYNAPPRANSATKTSAPYRPFSDDSMYGSRRRDLAKLESAFQATAIGIGSLVRGRRQLGRNLLDSGAKWIAVGAGGEAEPLLASAMRKIGKGFQVQSEILHHLADLDSGPLFMRSLELFARQVAYLQDQLAHSFSVQIELDYASRRAETTKHSLVVLKAVSSLKPDKVSAALEEFEEAKKHKTFRQGQADRLAANLPSELERFEAERLEDGRAHLLRYANQQLVHQRRILEPFLSALPDLNQLKRQVHLAQFKEYTPSVPSKIIPSYTAASLLNTNS